jgi:hypothetical protein
VQESFAVRYARIDPAYRRLESSPDSVSDQLPELRRTAHTLTVLRERAEGLAAPNAARELRRRLIAYFREQELIAQELLKVTAFIGEIQKSVRSIHGQHWSFPAGWAGPSAQTTVPPLARRMPNGSRRRPSSWLSSTLRRSSPSPSEGTSRAFAHRPQLFGGSRTTASRRRPFAKSVERRWRSRPTRQPGRSGRLRARTTPGALGYGRSESNSSGSSEFSSASTSTSCARRESARADPRRAKIPEGGRFAAAAIFTLHSYGSTSTTASGSSTRQTRR